jgi:hypothetical protein
VPPELPTLAAVVREQCELLARSLVAVRNAAPASGWDAFAEHLTATRPVEAALTASVGALNARRAEFERLPAAARAEVEQSLAAARRQLHAAADAYARMASQAAEDLRAIRVRLAAARQGARTLRTYRQAAR